MKPSIAAAALFSLTGCVPSQDTPGTVTQINGASVTIRGAADLSLANIGKPLQPTQAMVAQAKEICPGAKFVSAVGVAETNYYSADYLFKC